jgi:hypothetical protein
MTKTLFEVTAETIARRIATIVDGSDVAYRLYKNEVKDAMIKRLLNEELDKLDGRYKQLLTESIS